MSKPFIVAAVIVLFTGSFIGAVWMMTIFSIGVPQWFGQLFQQHKILQINGFLTLLIMGVGYMIVPRFRNVSLPFVKYAYLSFFIVLASLIAQIVTLLQISIFSDKISFTIIMITTLRVSGIFIFVTIIFLTLKIRPKRLRVSDYFIALSVVTLLIMNIFELSQMSGIMNSKEDTAVPRITAAGDSLTHIELWLLFAIVMIFGIEYKTLPSFLGFIRPRSIVGLSSFILTLNCVIIGFLSMVFETQIPTLQSIFNIIFFTSVVTFTLSIYAFGGFDNSEIIRLIKGEKKIRYNLTVPTCEGFICFYSCSAFLFQFYLVFHTGQDHETYRFALYDLAIHTIAIGFIGTTISLYLPLMLPPITGKTVQFTNLNRIPLLLIVSSLGLRAVGDIIVAQGNSVSNLVSQSTSLPTMKILSISLGLSGWFVVIAMIMFVITLHRSMK